MQQLTSKQQAWLDHINQALSQNISMSAYAKQHHLSIKAFYCARTALVNIGILPAKISTQLVSVTATDKPVATPSSCRVTLLNGVILDFSGPDVFTLIDKVNKL